MSDTRATPRPSAQDPVTGFDHHERESPGVDGLVISFEHPPETVSPQPTSSADSSPDPVALFRHPTSAAHSPVLTLDPHGTLLGAGLNAVNGNRVIIDSTAV
eukprot:2965389-Rhodomonas_salina.1